MIRPDFAKLKAQQLELAHEIVVTDARGESCAGDALRLAKLVIAYERELSYAYEGVPRPRKKATRKRRKGS